MGRQDRGSRRQITFSGLGQHAPLDAKTAWDPDFAKRKRLQAALTAALPGFSVRIGGSTSIDNSASSVGRNVSRSVTIRRVSSPSDRNVGVPPPRCSWVIGCGPPSAAR